MFSLFLYLSTSIVSAGAQDEREAAESRMRLSLSGAAFNGAGSVLASGRYGDGWGVRLGFWLRDSHVPGHAPHVFLGGDYLWKYSHWRYGIGLAWLDRNGNAINGTHANFSLSVAYDISDRFFIEVMHFSHGSALGIRGDIPNQGWDFIGIGVAL